jgi:ABC-2 type transport system permease protein
MISFLNLAVVGLILSTFTTRFIYPVVSLEGRRLWILDLAPLSRDSILIGKFLFAAVGSLLPCALLIFLSDLVLHIAPSMLLVHQLTCLILCVGLSGLAVGLGARMPDLREESPSKIAAGFGGTLNLVLSALYIVAVVLLTALPCHFYLETAQRNLPGYGWVKLWMVAGTAGALALGLLTTVLPMWLGLRAFRRLEV